MNLPFKHDRILAAGERLDTPSNFVEMSLAPYEARANRILFLPPRLAITGIRGTLRSLAAGLRDRIRRWRNPDADRGASWGFQILGVKES
jgi:hypothetical protein